MAPWSGRRVTRSVTGPTRIHRRRDCALAGLDRDDFPRPLVGSRWQWWEVMAVEMLRPSFWRWSYSSGAAGDYFRWRLPMLLMQPKTRPFSAPLDGPDAREPGACRSMPARLGSASLD